MKNIDLNTWKRKEHFEFFSQFTEPFFGVVVDVDCTEAYGYVKEKGISFYAWYLHKSLVAVNQIPEFRYRIVNEQPVEFDEVHIAGTTLREDETFGFTFVPYSAEFDIFQSQLQHETAKVKDSEGLVFNEDTSRVDVIHYSTVPWISFSGLTHARNLKHPDSMPKITFGKASLKEGRMMMPVAVNCHHALVDGLHVGKFFELFQQLLNQVED